MTRDLDDLVQTGSIADYIKEHAQVSQKAPAVLDLESAFCRQMLMRNIKPNLYRLMNISWFKTLAETYAEARNAEDKSKAFNCPVAGGENTAKKGK